MGAINSAVLNNRIMESEFYHMKRFILLGIFLIFGISSAAYGWDLQFGYHRLKPLIGADNRDYEGAGDSTISFKPEPKNTAVGQSFTFGVVIDEYSIQLEQGEFSYLSDVPISNTDLSGDREAEVEFLEKRIGVNYHIQRELAGLYIGTGISKEEETITTSSGEWSATSTIPFIKLGLDVILGDWKLRSEQIHLWVGPHVVRVVSIGVLFQM